MATKKKPAEAAPLGVVHSIALDLPEFASVCARYELPAPSELSPLPDLIAAEGARGTPRPLEIVLDDVAAIADDTVSWALGPLATPDRVIDLRSALFGRAPAACRLFASARTPDVFVGLRPHIEHDYELLFPYSTDDLEVWVQLQLQFSSGLQFPLPDPEMSAEQLAFLLVLADAYKASFVRSFGGRRHEMQPVSVSLDDILEAQNAARGVADRRWIAHAANELFGLVSHPGGATGIVLPAVTEVIARAEFDRYAAEGLLTLIPGKRPSAQLGLTLTTIVGSLFTWTSIVSLHDMQVTGGTPSTPQAGEEMLMYIVTDSGIWTIASSGLGRAGADLSAVRFTVRTCDLVMACEVVREFLAPAPGVKLGEEFYAAAAARAAQRPVPSAAVPVAPAPAPAAVWRATHRVPASGLRAWDAPDPERAPVANLDPGLDVVVDETLGAWAHIVCSNGWTAWTDGRALEAIR